MSEEPKGSGIGGLILAKLVCCGGLVLVVSGALSGVGAWLVNDGWIWILATLLTAGAYMYFRFRVRPRVAQEDDLPHTGRNIRNP